MPANSDASLPASHWLWPLVWNKCRKFMVKIEQSSFLQIGGSYFSSSEAIISKPAVDCPFFVGPIQYSLLSPHGSSIVYSCPQNLNLTFQACSLEKGQRTWTSVTPSMFETNLAIVLGEASHMSISKAYNCPDGSSIRRTFMTTCPIHNLYVSHHKSRHRLLLHHTHLHPH